LFLSLFLDGVFAEHADGSLEFHPADPPSDEDVARLLAARITLSSSAAVKDAGARRVPR
jgi:hypothetical protein